MKWNVATGVGSTHEVEAVHRELVIIMRWYTLTKVRCIHEVRY